MRFLIPIILSCYFLFAGCKEKAEETPAAAEDFSYSGSSVDGQVQPSLLYTNLGLMPAVRISFTAAPDPGSVAANIFLNETSGAAATFNTSFENEGKTLLLTPAAPLLSFKSYILTISGELRSKKNSALKNSVTLNLRTGIDLSNKFPVIPDHQLLDLVQKQTFKYFWDFAHPVSGLARERNTSGNTVTSGGSGFGIMAIVVAVSRSFISRTEGLERLQKIVSFLGTKARRFHGAFPHWLDGGTGDVIPFSTKDNGADLVETSYLVQGLLTARQYFDGQSPAEAKLRNDINGICNTVEWSWFRKGGGNVLYWHWSPDFNWEIGLPIRGWNEALITYVLAASSTDYAISKEVYDTGWAKNGAMANGVSYFGVQLPLGPANGGPLFFSHYSFLGINPFGLSDAYANYEVQNKAHTLINYTYCRTNPKGYTGYSEECWGLTASDDINGYMVHDPGNDNGVISPTAALSSFPYTPEESMRALKFFYYKLGDRLWGTYGFYDAFSLKDAWFAGSFLAIDQGPVIIMIENYRSGLLWNLFMSCPEVRTGMQKLGFTGPGI